jgi:hypothetical protein
MNLGAHPLMLCMAISFWGWQTGLWVVAVPAALLLALPRWVAIRWDLTLKQRYRVTDFCVVLSLLLTVFLFVTAGSPRFIILLIQWLPVLMLPIVLVHAWGSEEKLSLDVLFWGLRAQPFRKIQAVEPWFPYLALWLLAASAANARDQWFYGGLVAITACSLLGVQPWRHRLWTRLASLSIAALLGFGLQYGLHQAQQSLEAFAPSWLSGSGAGADPYRSLTDIGHLGSLKNSETIVLRVTTEDGTKPPRLLHRASYNNYFGVTWHARRVSFAPVLGAQRWDLEPNVATPSHVTIHDFSAQRNPVLSLPAGTAAIENLTALSMRRNQFGAIQIDREPGFFSYRAAYVGGHAFEEPPSADDLRLPVAERQPFEKQAADLGVNGLPETEITDRVTRFFADGYRYSLFQAGAPMSASPVTDFLLRSKSGHCEYFATATALLLRAAGIPARYATGFAVLEYSPLEKAWVVRDRHAHAWVRAYVNGQWVDVDTTPPTWDMEERAVAASSWSYVSDMWVWARFRLAGTWNNLGGSALPAWAGVLVLPLVLWLALRLYRSRQRGSANKPVDSVTPCSSAGGDSEFYTVEARLASLGLGRLAQESVFEWFERIKCEPILDSALLAQIVELHSRYRFDPLGLDLQERAQLRALANEFLRRLPAKGSPAKPAALNGSSPGYSPGN